VIGDAKSSFNIADLGTTGSVLLERVATEPIIPMPININSNMAMQHPINDPNNIFQKFFIGYND
jgi:hypothetical protein